MKKQEKIDLIQQAIDETAICRCYYTYDPGYLHCYPNSVNDKFILAQEEDDFILDGYFIRKISQLKTVEIKTDKCAEINRIFGVTNEVQDPGIDISSWQSIFHSLAQLDTYIIIEDNINDQFAIGVIEKVLKDRLYFRRFNAMGVWYENLLEIRYSQITSVEWGSRYAEYWKRYMERC